MNGPTNFRSFGRSPGETKFHVCQRMIGSDDDDADDRRHLQWNGEPLGGAGDDRLAAEQAVRVEEHRLQRVQQQ